MQPKRLVKAKLGEQERCSANRTQNGGPAGFCSAYMGLARRAEVLFGELKACSAYRSQQTTPTTDFWPLLGEQVGVFGEQHAVPSPSVRKRLWRKKEPDSDENLMEDSSDREINIT